jgi:hypothetical protein
MMFAKPRSNPNDIVDRCPECGERTLYTVDRDTEVAEECDCGYRLVLKYKRGTMSIPKGVVKLEDF